MSPVLSHAQRCRSVRHWSCSGAFTLVELLVVIALITLLMAILLPVLAKAKESAARAKCLMDTRQVMIAARSYQDDSRTYFPSTLTTPGNLGVQKQLVDGGYTYSDAFTNRACPYGPTTYSESPGSYYYGQTPGVVAIGLNELLQTGYSYTNPPSNTMWTPNPPYAPTYYPNQGPFSDRHKRVRTHPEMVMVASDSHCPTAGLIPVVHSMGTTTGYFLNQPIPGRHHNEGMPWTFYDGHGAFVPRDVIDPQPRLTYTTAPYLLWEWTWRTMFHAPGMDN